GKVKAGANATLGQEFHEPVAIAIETVGLHGDDEKVPGMSGSPLGISKRSNRIDHCELLVIKLGKACAALDKAIQFGELVDAEGCLQVGEIVLPAWCHGFIAWRFGFAVTTPCVAVDAVESQWAELFRQPVIAGGDHATLSSGHILNRMEAKAGGP